MEDRPRRSLLGGLATSVTLAAGCLSSPETERDPDDEPESGPDSDPEDESTTDDADESEPADDAEDTDDGEILAETLFEFVPASIAADTMSVTAAVPGPLQDLGSHYQPIASNGLLGIDPESIDRHVAVDTGSETSEHVMVLAGDFEPEGEPVRKEYDGIEYDRYETDIGVGAVYDDHLVVADSSDGVTAAIDARRGETDRLLERHSNVESALSTVDAGHLTSVHFGIGESLTSEVDVDAEAVRYLLRSMTVPDSETLEVTWGIGFVDAEHATNDAAKRFADVLTRQRGPFLAEPTTAIDGRSLTVSFVEDLEARRERAEYESPGGLTVRDVDPDAEYVEIELGSGEPTPVEALTLELDGETYDRDIWAGDAETIAAGDVLRVRTADVEPNTQVTLRHEMNGVVSSSSTSILSHFEFEIDRDHESGAVTVTYRDEFQLSGDEITIGVYDAEAAGTGRDAEPERTHRPWTGERVEAGDRAEIGDVDPGTWIVVGWDGETFGDGFSHHRVRPPGTVSFERDREAGRLAVTLEFEHDETRQADAYEIRVGDEPADTQWNGERIESGSTVRLETPDVGQRVSVVWRDGDIPVGFTRIRPNVEIELHRREELVVEHVGGRPLPVEDLRLHVFGDDVRDDVTLDEVADGQFAEGDTIDVELGDGLEDVETLVLLYDGMKVAEDHAEE